MLIKIPWLPRSTHQCGRGKCRGSSAGPPFLLGVQPRPPRSLMASLPPMQLPLYTKQNLIMQSKDKYVKSIVSNNIFSKELFWQYIKFFDWENINIYQKLLGLWGDWWTISDSKLARKKESRFIVTAKCGGIVHSTRGWILLWRHMVLIQQILNQNMWQPNYFWPENDMVNLRESHLSHTWSNMITHIKYGFDMNHFKIQLRH